MRRDLDQTPESLAKAKQHQQQERERIFARTGLRVVDAPFVVPPLVIVGCPKSGCPYVVGADREGQAIRKLAAHLVRGHQQES